jgi:microcystin-dependent protein
MKRLFAIVALACTLSAGSVNLAAAQEPYLGEVRMFAYNWCPNGWLQAAGQQLNIAQYTALFSLLGTSFGGNGTTNFNLPNLSGRSPDGQQANGVGQPFGAAYGNSIVTLTIQNLPSHTHQLTASSGANSVNSPAGALTATFSSSADKVYTASGAAANTPMSTSAIGFTGGNIPVTVQSPALSMNWCVATVGIYPTRP